MFEHWEDIGFRFGPFSGAGRVRYRSTGTSHVLRIRIGAEVKKQDIRPAGDRVAPGKRDSG